MNTEEYCQKIVAQPGSSLYYSLLFQPTKKRDALIALHAWAKTIDDIILDNTEPSVAKIKLLWWRDQLELIEQENSEHPIIKGLYLAVTDYALPKNLLIAFIEGALHKLESDHCETENDLYRYCYHDQSIIFILAASIQGHSCPQVLQFAENCGLAVALILLIADLHRYIHCSKIYFPLEDLKSFDLSYEELQAHKMTDKLRKLLDFYAQKARLYHQKALQFLPKDARVAQNHSIILTGLMVDLLNEIEKDHFNVLDHQIQLTPLRKFLLALKMRVCLFF